jgi:hypothetical protein
MTAGGGCGQRGGPARTAVRGPLRTARADRRPGGGRADGGWRLIVSVSGRALVSEAVLLDLDSGMYYGLNGVATTIWNRMAGAGEVGVERLVTDVVGEYAVEPDVATRHRSVRRDARRQPARACPALIRAAAGSCAPPQSWPRPWRSPCSSGSRSRSFPRRACWARTRRCRRSSRGPARMPRSRAWSGRWRRASPPLAAGQAPGRRAGASAHAPAAARAVPARDLREQGRRPPGRARRQLSRPRHPRLGSPRHLPGRRPGRDGRR